MKYINTILLGFIILWVNNTASSHDKQAVRAGINKLFNEPRQSNEIDYAGLPQYRLKANTNVVGRLLVINEDQLKNLHVDMPNVTIAKLNTWKQNKLNNPNRVQWARGADWEQVVADNGLEKVPVAGGDMP